MPAERGYDIFPRTWKARLLLALAFAGGLAIVASWVFLLLLAPLNLLSLETPCKGSELDRCLEPRAELAAIADGRCSGAGRRVCLAPLGDVSPELVRHLTGYYEDEYGLSISVLAPAPVPRELVDDEREQVDAVALIRHMIELHPEAAADPDAVLIGLTPVDIYNSRRHYRFLFGLKGSYENPEAIISTYRMDLRSFTFGLLSDDDLMFSRARKLFTKYVGLLYYGLLPSDDPESPLYDSILSTRDLDRMKEPLDLGARR